MPIVQSSTYEYGGRDGGAQVRYIRLNNTPNHRVLHAKLAALEPGEAALVTASGMAAISATLLALARAGDHLLVQDGVYGGTQALVTQDLPPWGSPSTSSTPTRPLPDSASCGRRPAPSTSRR